MNCVTCKAEITDAFFIVMKPMKDPKDEKRLIPSFMQHCEPCGIKLTNEGFKSIQTTLEDWRNEQPGTGNHLELSKIAKEFNTSPERFQV